MHVVRYPHRANIIQHDIGMVVISQDRQRDVFFACCLGDDRSGKGESGVRSEPAGLGFRKWIFEIFGWSGRRSLIVVQQTYLPPQINLGEMVRPCTHDPKWIESAAGRFGSTEVCNLLECHS
jgi:hypothetical protein